MIGSRRHWAAVISLPSQRATEPAERGGAPGASPQGTAPGTGLGARSSLSPVSGPWRQAPTPRTLGRAPDPAGWCLGQRLRPGASPWEGDPRRRDNPSPFRSGQLGVSGRKALGGEGGLKGSPASVADAATHLARSWRGGQVRASVCRDPKYSTVRGARTKGTR